MSLFDILKNKVTEFTDDKKKEGATEEDTEVNLTVDLALTKTNTP